MGENPALLMEKENQEKKLEEIKVVADVAEESVKECQSQSEKELEKVVTDSSDEETVQEESVENDQETTVPEGLEAKWYALHTYSSYENVAKENLEIVKQKYNLYNRIFDVVIPMEDVIEEKNGKRKVVSKKVMPGYILAKIAYEDDIWHAITRTRGITGFVGPKGRPLPLTDEEIRKMRLEKIAVVNVNFTANDKVEVLEGPLNGFVGTVISVDQGSSKCRVMVEMFGRETPVDFNVDQVRKID